MATKWTKKLGDYLPILRQLGIEYLLSDGGGLVGGIQLVEFTWKQTAGGKVVFADLGIANQAGTDYIAWFTEVGGTKATIEDGITCVAKANLVDGETVTIGDGIHASVVFEFDVNGTGVTAGRVQVNVSAATDAASVAVILAAAINAENAAGRLFVTADVTDANGTIDLTHEFEGNFTTSVTDTVVDGGFATQNLAGGVDPVRPRATQKAVGSMVVVGPTNNATVRGVIFGAIAGQA